MGWLAAASCYCCQVAAAGRPPTGQPACWLASQLTAGCCSSPAGAAKQQKEKKKEKERKEERNERKKERKESIKKRKQKN